MASINRRNFLRTSAIGVTGAAITANVKASSANSAFSEKEEKKNIITRKLGNTGIVLPIISFGCGRVDSPALIKAALKIGINHFDTAHGYRKGNSEKLLGEVLKEYPRDSYTIATKVKPQETKEEFLKLLDVSLERLQTSYVDILYLHAVKERDVALQKEMVAALKAAKESGKTRHIGISTHRNEPEIIQAAIESNLYEVVLVATNFKQKDHAQIKEKIESAANKGIGIIGMKVMAGAFIDKDKTKPINCKAALKWVLQNENIHSTIPSMINLEQLQENSELLYDFTLTEEEKSDIEKAKLEAGLFCDGCERCIRNCPKNLNIPDFMRAYMYSYGYNEQLKAKELLLSQNAGENPCSDCTFCNVKCIKGFNVGQKIADVNRLISIPDQFLA